MQMFVCNENELKRNKTTSADTIHKKGALKKGPYDCLICRYSKFARHLYTVTNAFTIRSFHARRMQNQIPNEPISWGWNLQKNNKCLQREPPCRRNHRARAHAIDPVLILDFVLLRGTERIAAKV